MSKRECYECKNYNNCLKSVKKSTEDCFIPGEPDIKKPCKTCENFCGTNAELGDMCSKDGSCAKYNDWFLSKNGWRKTVEPFRKLAKSPHTNSDVDSNTDIDDIYDNL